MSRENWTTAPNVTDQLIASWYRNKPRRIAEGDREDGVPWLEVGLSILRKWPIAFRAVCHQDTDAAAIAVKNGWYVDPIPSPNKEQIAAASASAKAARTAITGARSDRPPLHQAAE